MSRPLSVLLLSVLMVAGFVVSCAQAREDEVAASSSASGGGGSGLSTAELEAVLQDILAQDPQEAQLSFPLTRHMMGQWSTVWTHACPPKGEHLVSSKGTITVSNLTQMSFSFFPAARYLSDFDNKAVHVNLQGEGVEVPYAPFLRAGAIPGIGRRGGRDISLGYQICTISRNQIRTFTEQTKFLGEETETTVLRGFVFEELRDDEGKVLVLDRCVEGLNRNFNFIVTAVGEPLTEEERTSHATQPSQLTRKLRLVRIQFRLPGSMKCQTEDSIAYQHADIDAIREAAPQPYDYASDEAWEVLLWTRSDPIYQSFLDRHFAMLVFAVLFIFFRIYTGYRYNSQKLEIQRGLLEQVQAGEQKCKEEIMAEVKQRQSAGGKKAKK